MKRILLLAASALFLALPLACSSNDTPAQADTGVADGGIAADGGGGERDAVVSADASEDAGTMDAESMDAMPGDALPPDATGLPQEIEPGDHVQVSEGRVTIGDSFATVKQTLGATFTRTQAMYTRSYDWTLSGGITLTIWFVNTNLDDDDMPPNDVDDTDRVLWIAVTAPFSGKTSKNVGIGSTRAEIEAAAPTGYGPAPHTVAITTTPGTLAEYFTTGFLVAYDTGDLVRTFTVSRAYPVAPDGTIDPPNAQLDFGAAGRVQGLRGWTDMPLTLRFGTQASDVMSMLGAPDAQGEVMISGQPLTLLSYAFIGIEVFCSSIGSLRVAFVSVHAPYYGKVNGQGVGSTQADLETAIGRGAGMVSAMNAQFFCYEGGNDPDVAVTYSTDPVPVATTITVPLVRVSDATTCP